MQDPEFEKIVRQKMEELNFRPPEVIWGKVELEIKDNQRSKRILFWFLLFSGLLIAGGAFTLINGKSWITNQFVVSGKAVVKLSVVSSNNREILSSNPKNKLQQINKKKSVDIQNNLVMETKPDLGRKILIQPGAKPTASNLIKLRTTREDKAIADKPVIPSKEISGLQHAVLKNAQRKNIISSTKPGDVGVVKNKNLPKVESTDSRLPTIDNQVNHSVVSDQKNFTPKSENKPLLLQATPESVPPSKNEPNAKAQVKQADSAMNNVFGIKKQQSPGKGHTWAIGITLSPGVSESEKGIFGSKSSTDVPAYFSTSSNGSPAGGYPGAPSAIRPDFSFLAGAFIQKTMVGRWSLVVGLNYHYYSNSIKTGYKIDSLPAGYINTPNFANIPASINSYYLTGENRTYKNHFHFIEVPVAFQLHLNRNRKFPVAWEAGLTVSRMIASDALHYDQTSGIYYPNNNLFNRTQIGTSSAILFGFYHDAHLFQIGPTIQYGISNMLNSNSGDNQHLLYYGLKLTMLSRKTFF
jgi:Outer membrane protein beta-barrel domain